MDEMISASDARRQWKELLDRAVLGEVIKIERGGVIFYLATSSGMTEGMGRVVDTAISLGRHITEHKAKQKAQESPETATEAFMESRQKIVREVQAPKSRQVSEYCEHGQIKGQCLVKGCRYGSGKGTK